MTEDVQLHNAARQFADLLLQRRPDWARYVRARQPVTGADHVVAGSLWAEIPSPTEQGPVLSLLFGPGEAMVGLGAPGAEQVFVWDDPAERVDALQSVLNFVADVAAAELVLVWRRHRFLWKTWETAHFCPAAEAIGDRRILRIEGWPEPAQ